MFILILNLFFTPSSSLATTLTCDKSTAVSKPGAFTDQPFKIDKQDYIIRKGPQYCYIDAKDGYTDYMLEACDSIVTNTELLEVSCMQDGKKVTFGPEKLKALRKKKADDLDDDLCNEFLGNDRPVLPNDKEDNTDPRFGPRERMHFPTQPLNGGLLIGESEVNGGRCTLKQSGKSQQLECDEIYKNDRNSGNKLICVHGYKAVEMVGALSDGTLISIEDLLDSELNLCHEKSGTVTFSDLTTDKIGENEKIEIHNCQLVSGPKEHFCRRILLKEKNIVCEPLNSHQAPIILREINPVARIEIYKQLFDGEKTPVKRIRNYMQKQIFLPKDKKRFESELLQGAPIIREATRKASQ